MREYKIITKNDSIFLITVNGKELRITSIDGKHKTKDNPVITLDNEINEQKIKTLIANKYHISIRDFEGQLSSTKGIFFEDATSKLGYGYTSRIKEVWLRLI